MSEDADGAYEAVPLQCHACAARDAESRNASEMKRDNKMSAESFDGLYFGVVRREVNPSG